MMTVGRSEVSGYDDSHFTHYFFDPATRTVEGGAGGVAPSRQRWSREMRLFTLGFSFREKARARGLSPHARLILHGAVLAHPSVTRIDEIVYLHQEEVRGRRLEVSS
jgi:hypothetical protein